MTEDQKKKYEEAAKAKYSDIQTSIYRVTAEQIAIDLYITGAEDGKKEGWNEAIEACANLIWQYRHQSGTLSAAINDELQKLRK